VWPGADIPWWQIVRVTSRKACVQFFETPCSLVIVGVVDVCSCGKLLKSEDEVQLHATRSGHTNFSESVEEVKPLTEEEKKAQLAKYDCVF